MNANRFTRAIGNCTRFLKKNSSIILAIAASVGVVATVVTTVKATEKVVSDRDSAEVLKGEELTPMEEFKAVAPNYILPVSLAVATVGCIVGSAVISKKNEKALISAYGLVNTSFKRYRGKLIELHGQEADDEIRDALAREYADFHVIGLDIPDQKAIWVDEISGQTVVAYEREIMDAEYHMNRNFTMRGYAPLNELYMLLGMHTTEEGNAIGWSMSDGYYWIDFEHRRLDNPDDNGTPMYSINYIFYPDADYLREFDGCELPWVEEVGGGK